jgi:tartrate dehydratase beta subunit/fumarate hydratase class I family protein
MFSDLCKSVLQVGDEVLISGIVFTGRKAVDKHLHEDA